MSTDQLDGMSAEQLRELVRGPQAPTTFDPNHPPHVPYVFREFPKMMYSLGGHRVVNSKAEEEGLGVGWYPTPNIPAHDPPAEKAEQGEAAPPKRGTRKA